MALRKSDLGSIWACLLVCLLVLISNPQAQTYQVAADSGLTALAANLTGSGVRRVQFAPGGYAAPGQLSLTASSADSIIFERSAPDTSLVKISSRLLRFEGLTNTKVIIRGLAFRLDSPTAELLNGRASANQRLLVDSCIIYADSVNSTFISWLGKKAEVRRTMLVIRKTGVSARIDLEADTVDLTHNLFNFEGIVVGKTLGHISLTRNTVNKTQFNLTTDGTTSYSFLNNRFAYPPSQNRLPVGESALYPIRILGAFSATGSSALSNRRDTAWTGFDFPPASSLFTDASNTTAAGIVERSDTTLWDWRIPSETDHGAWSGPTAQALPPHNIFPSQTSLTPDNLPLNHRPTFNFDSASIPRYVPISLATSITYPAHDSLRTYFVKDTAYVIGTQPSSAFFTLKSFVLSNPNTSSTPRLLGAPSGTSFVLGPAGAAGTNTFVSPSPSARILIPAFGAQNTWKGSNVVVANLGNEASITFASVTRAGRTELISARQVDTSILNSLGWKRNRPLLRNSKPVGFGFTSNADLGQGSTVTFTLPRAGNTVPYLRDSVFAFDGKTFHKVSANETHYSVTIPFSNQALDTIQAREMAFALFEKLAIGRGNDTLLLAQGHRFLSTSDSGYQFSMETTAATSADRIPYFDDPISFFKPSWTGRKTGSRLTFEMKKSSVEQAAYVFLPRPNDSIDSVVVRTPDRSTAENLAITLNTDDNSKSFLLGRKYSLPRGIYFEWSDGEHSLSHLMSTKPGEMRVDTAIDSTAQANLNLLLNDTLLVIKQRHIITENLNITEYFEVAVKKIESDSFNSVRAFVFRNEDWIPLVLQSKSEGWFFTLLENDRQFVLLRRLPKPDPVKPIHRLQGLSLTPLKQDLADSNSQADFDWTYTPDNVKTDSSEGKVRFELCEWASSALSAGPKADSNWSNSLDGLAKVDDSGKVTRLKAADSVSITLALRIVSVARPNIADTALVILLSKASSDTIKIKPDAFPEIKTVEGQPDKVNIVPKLDTTEAKKLQHVVVTWVSIDPTGTVSEKVDTLVADSATGGFILTVSDVAITTFKVNYVSTQGVSTEVTTPFEAFVPSGFRAAVNALAPALSTERRELIGSPFKVRLGELFPGLDTIAKSPSPEIAVYEGGGWNRIDKHADHSNAPGIADVTLDAGKGYLLYLPEGIKPQLPDSVISGRTASSLLAPVTLKLVQGWQIITNPKPFAIADVNIQLDSNLVSYFCKLNWTGSPLQEEWDRQVDTLRPFVGYAVYANKETEIIFNPRKALVPQAKKATAKFVNLHLQTSWGESGTLTLTDAKTTRVFPKQGFASRLQTSWKRGQGLLLSDALQPGMSETFLVMGKSQGKVRLSLTATDPKGEDEAWFVWSPTIGQVLALSERPEIAMGPGWQEFQLLKLAPSTREAEEKRLRSLYPAGFSYRIDFKRGRITAAVPVGTGASNSLSLLLFDLTGRIAHQSLHRNLQPGWHEWPLPRLQTGRTAGAAFLRLQWRDAQGQQSKLIPLGAQP